MDFNRLKWARLKEIFKSNYGEYPSVISALFLVGLEQIPPTYEKLTKEQKQDVIHIGLCKVLEKDNIYNFSHFDDDGWPHFNLTNKARKINIEKQENYIKECLINYYFDEEK